MKKWIAIILTAVLLAGCLTGCSGGRNMANGGKGQNSQTTPKQPQLTQPSKPTGSTGGQTETSDRLTGTDKDELCYVLIYNPLVYKESKPESMGKSSTGFLGSQVDTDVFRGDGLPDDLLFTDVSQKDLLGDIDLEELLPEGDRGDVLIETYKKGDRQTFYAFSENSTSIRLKRTFTCGYAGQYCYVWAYDSKLNTKQLQTIGKEFDQNIYRQATEMFGKGRFGAMGGKLNILIYPMQDGLAGCYYLLDSFASGEATSAEVARYGLNLNHDIIHVNTRYPEYYGTDFCYGTLAHEYQHLIAGSDMFFTFRYQFLCETWLNEVMSAYIEEKLYDGSRAASGHIVAMMNSDRIRRGQSLYNFDNDGLDDFGVYGSVFYFSQYLSKLAGQDVYSRIHTYWRTSYSSTLCDAEAIYHALPVSARSQLDSLIDYPSHISFATEEDALMSKLTLAFYLDLLQNSKDYEGINIRALLYDEINAADIEGGGRIIIAIKDGEFRIPEDAAPNLIYVGLNRNFEVITDFVYSD